jgi:protein-L-isoaspartate(D-aspartate) O-methyltransferase
VGAPGGVRLAAQLRPRVGDERVLAAIAAIPRDAFVPPELAARAWDNEPLPIGAGQTISQPLVVAHMAELLALRPEDRVLDVGTGSGYHAAVLAQLAAHVWTIEFRDGLHRGPLPANVTTVVGDGCAGLPGQAPFDAINVAAAGPEDRLARLRDQLADGGRLVAPVTHGRRQRLVRYRRTGRTLERTEHGGVRFVELV